MLLSSFANFLLLNDGRYAYHKASVATAATPSIGFEAGLGVVVVS